MVTQTKLPKISGWAVSTPASYSGEHGFESQTEDQISWQRVFSVLLSHSKQMLEKYPEVTGDCFLTHIS
jgi:hypothetical protein